MKSILIVDDDFVNRQSMTRLFTSHNLNAHEAKSEDRALEILATHQIDVVLCNAVLGKRDGLDALVKIRDFNKMVPVVMIADCINIRHAVDAIRRGASNYIIKPLPSIEIVDAVFRCLGDKENKLPTPIKTTSVSRVAVRTEYILSTSLIFQQMLETIDLVAPTNYSVILYGESGTGKEVFAREIHQRSKRASQGFQAIDCGTLSTDLARSVLFGHEQGAFTGAIKQHKGAFETASGGTLFLDEVTNLSLDVQSALLRVIQERKIKRLGGNVEIDVDVRIVVASNIRIMDAVKNGQFRADLFYRLNEFELKILPLRDRKDDILFYANHFLLKTNGELRKDVKRFSLNAISEMLTYGWPGNLRELRNVIRRAVLMGSCDEISDLSLPADQTDVAETIAVSRKENVLINHVAVAQRSDSARTVAADVLDIDRRRRGIKVKRAVKIDFTSAMNSLTQLGMRYAARSGYKASIKLPTT